MKRFFLLFVFLLVLGISSNATAQMPLRVNSNWYPRLSSYSFYGLGIYSFTFSHYNFSSFPPVTEYRPYANPILAQLMEEKKAFYYQEKFARAFPLPTIEHKQETMPSPNLQTSPNLPDVSIQSPSKN